MIRHMHIMTVMTSLTVIVSGCSMLPVPPQPLAHLAPTALNEAALAALAVNDRSTALILLRRARRLAPVDADIADNLRLAEQVDATIATRQPPSSGAERPAPALAPPQQIPSPPIPLPPLPPLPDTPIWPAK